VSGGDVAARIAGALNRPIVREFLLRRPDNLILILDQADLPFAKVRLDGKKVKTLRTARERIMVVESMRRGRAQGLDFSVFRRDRHQPLISTARACET
jgi:hypothetical protein